MNPKKILLTLYIIMAILVSKATETNSNFNKSIFDIEYLIITEQTDSAFKLLTDLDTATVYTDELYQWINGEKSNKLLLKISNQVGKIQDNRIQYINGFIERNITKKNSFDKDFLNIEFIHHHMLFEFGNPAEADKVLNEIKLYLEKYKGEINKESQLNYQYQINNHNMIRALIGRNIEGFEELLKKNIEIQQRTKNKHQLIGIESSKLDYYFLIGDKDSYYSSANKQIELNYNLDSTSVEYFDSYFRLVDLLIYQAESNKSVDLENKIFKILLKLYHSNYNQIRRKSLNYFIQYFTAYPIHTEKAKQIFKLFNVSNLPDLCFYNLKQLETDNNITNISSEYTIATRALNTHGYKDEVIELLYKSNNLIKDKYTKELSQNLAEFKIQKEKEKNKLKIKEEKFIQYIYITIAIVLFLLSLLLIRFQQLQRKKNKLLEKKEAEKTLLLKEIHHRVKNNFQIAIGLMDLQFREIEDKKVIHLLEEWKGKVKSMVMVHQNLYQNNDLNVPLENYIKQIINDITFAYSGIECQTQITSDINLNLDIDTAVNLGLILNELVNNSFKYGVENHRLNLTIHCSKKESLYVLHFYDNGEGIKNLDEIDQLDTFGLKLIHQLSKQIGGFTEIKNSNGAHFYIYFKSDNNKNLRKRE